MKFLKSVRAHRARGAALLAANFYNVETLLAVLRAAKQVGCELILQTSPSTLDYLGGPQLAAAMARAAAEQEGVRAWLHLDHATDLGLLRRCVAAGYDSVMIDASERPLDENIATAAEAVAIAHPAGVAVEAELGYVAKLGQADITADGYTRPDEARRFVEQTGVDLLAVAIGTAHGFYRKKPQLDLERLSLIHSTVDVPLVLHGGSGLDEATWQETVRRGVVKINFATEIKDTFMKELAGCVRGGEEIDLRKVFPPAMAAVTRLVAEKLRCCRGGSASKQAVRG